MKNKLIILQMNEVNFDIIKKYISEGKLKNFDFFLSKYNFIETQSEENYENLEPWIQWVSFYSGKKFDDHKVSHLNDFDSEKWNFFYELEKKYNKKLALFFPMNLKNCFSSNTIFVPDPWTETSINAENNIKKIFKIFKKMILENASSKINFTDFFSLLIFATFRTSINFKFFILKNLKKIFKFKFFKAIVFDRICWEMYKKIINSDKYDVSSLFMNSCAHVQHHYFLNSSVVNSKIKNPSWYLKNIDPVYECLKSYDNVLGELKKFKNKEFLILTGLSQSAIQSPVFYYNLKDPEFFFNLIDIKYTKILKRMSRDYTLFFNNVEDALQAKNKLNKIELNNKKFFSIKNSDNKLYLELIYGLEIKNKEVLALNNDIRINIKENINFIAIKNSIHNQKGYLISSIKEYNNPTYIWDVHKNILNQYAK